MDTVLITAFEPFGEDKENPTESVLTEIPMFLYNAKIIKVVLPVVYNQVFDVLLPHLEKHDPTLIIMMGLAGGRTHVSIERIAVNIATSKSPDNLGNILTEHTLVKDGQDGYFTTFPLERIMRRLRKKNLPVQVSSSAGTYVCNEIMYRTLHYLKHHKKDTIAGFIHMPYFPHQVKDKPGVASLERRHTVDTVLTIIDELINPVKLEVKQQ